MDFFLSDRMYRIRRIFFSFSQVPPARNALALAASLCLAGGLACEAGGDETEKEESRSAGEIHLSCCVSMVCHAAHLWFDPGALRCRLYRYGGFVLPSPPASPERTRTRDGGQAGRTQEEQNHVNPVYPVSYMKKDT